MRRSQTVQIRKTIRGRVPQIPFEKLARTIFREPRRRRGEHYQLSLVICGDALAAHINRLYRPPAPRLRRVGKKKYAPNVLSFSLDTHEGEIFLNAHKATREARAYRIAVSDRLAHLFVHGCLHLKGLVHGREMDRREKKILERFGFALSTH